MKKVYKIVILVGRRLKKHIHTPLLHTMYKKFMELFTKTSRDGTKLRWH